MEALPGRMKRCQPSMNKGRKKQEESQQASKGVKIQIITQNSKQLNRFCIRSKILRRLIASDSGNGIICLKVTSKRSLPEPNPV